MFQYVNSELCHVFNNTETTISSTIPKIKDPLNQANLPFIIYSEPIFESNLRSYTEAFTSYHDFLLAYSLKSLSNWKIMEIVKRHNVGVDCVSGGEVKKAIDRGIDPQKIVFAGVGKEDYEIALAVKNQILQINVESCEEIIALDRVTSALGTAQDIALRINPNLEESDYTHKKITTGKKENKFGINIDQIPEALSLAQKAKYLNCVGFSCHVGSQIFDISVLDKAYNSLISIASEATKHGVSLKSLDFGGGIGVQYSRRYPREIDKNEYATLIFSKLTTAGLSPKVIIEPGRSISSNCAILCSRVTYVKHTGHRSFVILNAGMNNLLRPALYDTEHEITPLTLNPNQVKSATDNGTCLSLQYSKNCQIYDFVGPICESSDVFAFDKTFQDLIPGDHIAILNAGAYCSSMKLSYNDKPNSLEFLIDSQGKVIAI